MKVFQRVQSLEEQVVNRALTDAKLEEAKQHRKNCVLIKSGSDFRAIECSSKLTELFIYIFEFLNPFVSVVGVKREYMENSTSELKTLISKIAEQKEQYKKIFQENDPEKVVDLLVSHYRNKKNIEASAAFKDLQMQYTAGKILLPGTDGAKLYESYQKLNDFVDEVVKDQIRRTYKDSSRSVESAAKMAVYALFLPLALDKTGEFFEDNMQNLTSRLQEVSDRMEGVDFSRESSSVTLEINNIVEFDRNVGRWLKAFQKIKSRGLFSPHKETSEKAEQIAAQLEGLQQKLKVKFKDPEKAELDIRLVQTTVMPEMEKMINELEGQRAEVKNREEALNLHYLTTEAAYLERERQLTLPMDLIREFELELFQPPGELTTFVEGLFLGTVDRGGHLRLLEQMNREALEDPETFSGSFPDRIEELLKEFEGSLSELQIKDHYQKLLEESDTLNKELRASNLSQLKRELGSLLESLASQLSPFIDPEDLTELYLTNLTVEEFSRMREVLMNQVEQSKSSGGWAYSLTSWMVSGKSEEEAQAELKSYMQNYLTVLELIEKKAPLVEQIKRAVILEADFAGLRREGESLMNQMEWFAIHPEEQAKQDRLVEALLEIQEAIVKYKNARETSGVTFQEVNKAKADYEQVLAERKKLDSKVEMQKRALRNTAQNLEDFKRIMNLK